MKFKCSFQKGSMMMKYTSLNMVGYLAVVAIVGIASLANAAPTESDQHESKGYRFERFFNYYMIDYLDGDQAHTLGLETLAEFELGSLEVDHRVYLEVADYPVEIAGKPNNPFPEIGEATGIGLRQDYLFDCELSPVCSPAYLEKHGAINSPAELASHALLQVYPSAEDWYVWLQANGAGQVNPDRGQQLESYDVALTSAAQGMGVALGQQPYIARDLATGSLVELVPQLRVRNPLQWHLTCRREHGELPKLRAFREWLLEEIRRDDTLSVSNQEQPSPSLASG